MSITLLAACAQVLGESGFDVPSAIVTADDKTALYVANASILSLRRHAWPKLIKSTTVTLTTDTDYALASDFWVYVPDTLWSGGGAMPVNMPTTPRDWTILKSGLGISAGQFNCRFINDRLEVQNPVVDDVLRYEYVSKNALTSSGGVAKERFTADTDLCVLDEELFCRDLKWRYKKEKGIADWQADFQEFERYLRYFQGANNGSQTLYAVGVANGRTTPYFNPMVT